MISKIFFSIILIKEQQQQELLVQIIDTVNAFVNNNALFADYGPIGLYFL
jgi:hypothetical protein